MFLTERLYANSDDMIVNATKVVTLIIDFFSIKQEKRMVFRIYYFCFFIFCVRIVMATLQSLFF